MRWSWSLIILLSSHQCGAAVYALTDIFSTNALLGQPPLGPGGGTSFQSADPEVININDRVGLVPGIPIRVTVQFEALTGGAFLRYSSPYTFQDTFTFAAILGSETFSVSSIFTLTQPVAPAQPTGFNPGIGVMLPPLEFAVPWDTDLSAVTFRLSQSAFITGTDNITFGGGGGVDAVVQTQSVPESGTPVLVAGTVLSLVRRRWRA